jgi:hypothetical protein
MPLERFVMAFVLRVADYRLPQFQYKLTQSQKAYPQSFVVGLR